MPESSNTTGGVPANMPVTAPVAAPIAPTPGVPSPTVQPSSVEHLGGIPIAGKTPEGYKGPTVTPAPPVNGLRKPKLYYGSIKAEAMGYHSQSGYQAPGGKPFLVTEDEKNELGERLENVHEAEEGADHRAGDRENPAKNKPVGVENQPGGQTPV